MWMDCCDHNAALWVTEYVFARAQRIYVGDNQRECSSVHKCSTRSESRSDRIWFAGYNPLHLKVLLKPEKSRTKSAEHPMSFWKRENRLCLTRHDSCKLPRQCETREDSMQFTIAWNPLGFHIVDVFQKKKYVTRHAMSRMFFRYFWILSRIVAESFCHSCRQCQIIYGSDVSYIFWVKLV
jgi:hypothetical protein